MHDENGGLDKVSTKKNIKSGSYFCFKTSQKDLITCHNRFQDKIVSMGIRICTSIPVVPQSFNSCMTRMVDWTLAFAVRFDKCTDATVGPVRERVDKQLTNS